MARIVHMTHYYSGIRPLGFWWEKHVGSVKFVRLDNL